MEIMAWSYMAMNSLYTYTTSHVSAIRCSVENGVSISPLGQDPGRYIEAEASGSCGGTSTCRELMCVYEMEVQISLTVQSSPEFVGTTSYGTRTTNLSSERPEVSDYSRRVWIAQPPPLGPAHG